MRIAEVIVFIIYLIFLICIGVYFFMKSKTGGEKTYFLGGRQMGPWVSALSAGASDMSAWVLMGLPASIYAAGIGKAWIAIGLAIGYAVSWIIEAPRLRRFSIIADDSITIPQYLTNRFKSSSKVLQIICAVIFIFAYTIYAASSMKACGTLFNTVLGINASTAMYIAAAIIVAYTFLGGFSAVCWTDFFQGLLMLAALLIAPIFALGLVNAGKGAETAAQLPAGYWSLMTNWKDIISGLGWGLGYFGMPHILVRFMAIEDEKKIAISRRVASVWVVIAMFVALAIGVIGLAMSAAGRIPVLEGSGNAERVIIYITNLMSTYGIIPAIVGGVILSGILAATMSTADSQLLASASAISSDLIQAVGKKKLDDETQVKVAKITVVLISIIAIFIARDPDSSVFQIVSFAWAGFGAAFGPVVLLSLFWKKSTLKGALAGMITGGAFVFIWKYGIAKLGGAFAIYELLPAFLIALCVNVVVSLVTKEK